MKLLLGQKDVSPDWPDKNGRTPLSLAACNGHDSVVKLLLGREDIIPDRSDNYGFTPLLLAASKGHEGVVMLLRAREARNPAWYRDLEK